MIDNEIKLVATSIIIILIGITVYPFLISNRDIESFSQLGILGPNGIIGDYPREVATGRIFNLFLFIDNHEGSSQYYRIDVKFVEQNNIVDDMEPYPSPILKTYSIILANQGNSTIPVNFSFSEPSVNRRLVFELNRLNIETKEFQFQLRTEIWLNITAIG